jgi:hypothetical protein
VCHLFYCIFQSAVSWEHKEKIEKHASQKDYATGFGGKFGVQTDRQDKSAVGWDHMEKIEKHESQKGRFRPKKEQHSESKVKDLRRVFSPDSPRLGIGKTEMIIIKYCVLRAFPTLNVRNCNLFSLLFTFLADFLQNEALNKKKYFLIKLLSSFLITYLQLDVFIIFLSLIISEI